MKVLGLSGSIRSSSKTKTAVEVALEAAGGKTSQTELVHLGDYDLHFADGRKLENYAGDTKTVLDAIVGADAYLIGTPVYRESYSGLLKNLFDMIPRGRWQADVAPLENAAVGLIATGATEHHYLTIDQELRPVMGFFGAYTLPGGVYLHSEHFEEGAVADPGMRERLETLGTTLVRLGELLEDHEELRNLSPQV